MAKHDSEQGRTPLQASLVVDLGILLVPLAAGALLWWFGLAATLAVLIGLLPALVRHFVLLIRLALIVRRQHRLAPPFPRGLWGDIYRNLSRYQQRSRKSRKRQIRFTRRFREAANAVPDALVILDKQQRIEWANPAAAVLLGIHWPEDDGAQLGACIAHPELDDFITTGEYTRPLEIAPPHNRAIMISLRITPFGERKKQRLVVGRDITKIYHLNMIRRDFVANASHELRTPLTVIAGFLESLSDSQATPEGHRRPLTLMRNQTDRMCSIVEDLLTLSRLEMNDDSEDDQQPVDVPVLLDLVLQEARALSQGRQSITADINEELLLLGNPHELRSAFSNLIFNAVKHTPEGTRIRVTWREDDAGPAFLVADDGPGIAAEHLPRLTERFYRVDHARSRQSGGTGLGLAIVKHILNRHGTSLGIDSEPGRGSLFSCHFAASRALARRPLELTGTG